MPLRVARFSCRSYRNTISLYVNTAILGRQNKQGDKRMIRAGIDRTRLSMRATLLAGLMTAALSAPALAKSNEPIKIGVIAEIQAIAGASTPGGAQIAADEINAKGGVLGRKIEIVTYDNKSSSADSVRAFQRAVNEDKVSAVIASYISDVVLARERWAARLRTPLITPGAASNEITKAVHKDYDRNKFTFHGHLTSAAQAQAVCDAAKALL